MARKPKDAKALVTPKANEIVDHDVSADSDNIAAALSKEATFRAMSVWLVGTTPLIVHAWSQKAKMEMLQAQVRATKPGKTARDPQKDFHDSLYHIGTSRITGRKAYGFPAMGFKNAILAAAHKDRGIPRTVAQQALWIDAPIVRAQTAHADAICDMPLLRLWGTDPEMREDNVRIGSGMTKKATLAFRAQFTRWAVNLNLRFNEAVLSTDMIAFLIGGAGQSIGVGEWRNERAGPFGAFRIATPEESDAWLAYAKGGPLPESETAQMAPHFDLADIDLVEAVAA